jgi:hypothetical protein
VANQDFAMNFSWLWSPVNRRGQILDLLVFLANLFLLGPFARLLAGLGAGFTANDKTASQKLALIILGAFVSYTLGAMLKRAPLHARRSLPNPGYGGCLFLAWISLHITLSILGGAFIVSSFDPASKSVGVIAMTLLCTLPTFFVARVVFAPKKLEMIPTWRKSRLMELVADLLIVAAVVMLTIMWDIWFADIFTGTWPGETFGQRLIAAGLALGGFAFFYISPRFLFLIEDFNQKLTWATMGMTVAPLVGRILLETPSP